VALLQAVKFQAARLVHLRAVCQSWLLDVACKGCERFRRLVSWSSTFCARWQTSMSFVAPRKATFRLGCSCSRLASR
jgi:hypothetical protein